ncbi:TrbI/VirB10 family protein [Brevundimonas sp. A19_0]|uniref:TrbI/VirB10 family protein n=1 Tax=Brevundimonas sp. A19_0 TaxID=2821087 RepID=UPI001ADC2E6C|nr:TrbI/VirB10 family protein [Brevundimonas sp. A19_0]
MSGIVLFLVLDGQRRDAAVPSTQVRSIDQTAMAAELPPLYLPPPVPPPPPPPDMVTPADAPAPYVPVAPQAQASALPVPPPLPNYPTPAIAASPSATATATGPRSSDGPTLIIDTTEQASQSSGGGETTAPSPGPRTTRLRRPSTTIPQGALIPAVLETALDSTQPGQVRAIVSRDIVGFDGTRILIPRGSRLLGEYQSDMEPGQRRVLVQWTRLIRPDGVSIALASPATDLEGRAGMEGRVDNHFLSRFASALLQTTVNVGSAFATRSIGGDTPVVFAVTGAPPVPAAPGSTNGQPTIRVDAGALVAVQVARDLELPPVGPSR